MTETTISAAPDAPSTPVPPAVPPAVLRPVSAAARIEMLDILRGFAILGILAVNALAFAWPFEVFGNRDSAPFAWTGANLVSDWVVQVFFHDKSRSLFSMLFGVSIFLVGGERADKARGRLLRSRLFWLLLIGAVHGLAIWYGDILMHYAYTGFLMLLMRSMSARKLLWIGGGISLMWGVIGAAAAIVTAHLPPEMAGQMKPPEVDPAVIRATIDQVRGGWAGAMLENAKAWLMVQGFSLFMIPVTLPLMMLGLGLFKSGWLSGKAPVWTYLLAVAVGAAILAALGWYGWVADNAEGDPTGGLAGALAQFGFVVTMGYAAAVILLSRSAFGVVTRLFAPVGRMAFTNYLTQSLIMASLFYMPWGPRLYGQIEPGMLWAFIGGVWVLQLVWSPLWLSRFEMGPLEWVWRTLTYGRPAPLLKRV